MGNLNIYVLKLKVCENAQISVLQNLGHWFNAKSDTSEPFAAKFNLFVCIHCKRMLNYLTPNEMRGRTSELVSLRSIQQVKIEARIWTTHAKQEIQLSQAKQLHSPMHMCDA